MAMLLRLINRFIIIIIIIIIKHEKITPTKNKKSGKTGVVATQVIFGGGDPEGMKG